MIKSSLFGILGDSSIKRGRYKSGLNLIEEANLGNTMRFSFPKRSIDFEERN